MSAVQQKLVKGPVVLSGIHSSGKSVAVHEGKSHYIGLGIPGEEITFVSNRRKQGFRSGTLNEIITSSPHRVASFCRHQTQCGGCPWMHISYDHQLQLKREILCNALQKYGIETPEVPPVIPSPEPRHYRHRVEYAFDSLNTVPGFHGFENEVVPVTECYLQHEPSRALCEFISAFAERNGIEFYNRELKNGFLRSLSIRVNRAGECMVVLGFTEDRPADSQKLLEAILTEFPQVVSLNWTIHQSPSHSQMQGEIFPFGNMPPFLVEQMGEYKFRIHASSFFQPNAAQAENIFQTIQEWLYPSCDLNNKPGTDFVTDLYTGIGTIALFLAHNAKKVLGIEGSAAAIEDARENASINGIGNAEFITGDILETYKPAFLEKYGRPDVIVLDPPRSGTLIEIKKTINLAEARNVIYLSCNPVSLAFDLKQLSEKYRVTRIQPFDMLPHTHHLETLVMMERIS